MPFAAVVLNYALLPCNPNRIMMCNSFSSLYFWMFYAGGSILDWWTGGDLSASPCMHSAPWFKWLWLDIETTSPFHLWWDSIKPHLQSGFVEIEIQLTNSSYCLPRPLQIHGRSLTLSLAHFSSPLSLFCWHWISNKQIGLLSRSLILTPCFNEWRETLESILQLCPSHCFLHSLF